MSRERLEASGYIMSGEYYRIPKLLHIETYEGDLLSMLGQAYFFMGKFEQAYETHQKLYFNPNVCSERLCNKAPEEYDPLGKTIFEVLELSNGKHLMDILPNIQIWILSICKALKQVMNNTKNIKNLCHCETIMKIHLIKTTRRTSICFSIN